ncbi:MAG: PA3496 family putative envelope integrity protein [Pseudomonadota bacterium]
MAKNQAKQEPATEDAEVWLGEEAGDFEDAANDAAAASPAKTRLVMRHKIEDLIESRRLKKQISDYDMLDLDDDPPRAGAKKIVH